MIKRLTKSIFLLFVVTVYAIETLDFNSAELDRISIMTTNATELESYKTCSHDIYENLVELAGLCSVAYCISKRDIEKGPLDKVCPLEFCKENPQIEIFHVSYYALIYLTLGFSPHRGTFWNWLRGSGSYPGK